MFRLTSEQALVQAFRPRDRRRLEPPAGLTYPLFVRDYFAWTEPAGFGVNLVFAVGKGAPTGISFVRDHHDSAGARASLCSWCHTYGGGDAIGLLTTDVTSKRRVGVHLCLDLGCNARIEDAANRAGRSALDASQVLLGRIGRFASEALKIDLAGGDRG